MAEKKAQINADTIKATREAGGKRMLAVKKDLPLGKAYALDEAVKIIKSRAKAKFDETVEVAMNLGIDPRHADQMVRGVVNLPNGTGKNVRVAVFARDAKAEEARKAGHIMCAGCWKRLPRPLQDKIFETNELRRWSGSGKEWLAAVNEAREYLKGGSNGD